MKNIMVLGRVVLLVGVLIIGCSKKTPTSPESATITTVSGLQYVDLIVGTGKEAGDEDHVSVIYTGWLADPSDSEPSGRTCGTKFDSSLDKNKPFQFELGETEVMKGWDVGVTGMKVGGKRKLIIPPALGYGTAGKGKVPPNATLIYEIELLDIK